ncbi:MAG: peptide-methionine (S)-S-oxide reductase MsrA [Candidatus Brennerbacteria bacterium]|nr:peptide-methionine (S)-S-oxide reductase MsrA [Candidatus Brennerbacteria bacterium]
MGTQTETAVFGGGCFWCTEAVFKMLKGVVSVTPGYAGGSKDSLQAVPTYEAVCGGKTGHAEVIRIEFDPSLISYHDLLTVFFATHDPTALNRQGNDIGTQYRSIVLSTSDWQKDEAERLIKEIDGSHTEGEKVVTEVKPLGSSPAGGFYPAEDYHRDYYVRNKTASYCELIINPKLAKVQKQFSTLLKTQEE